MRRRRGVPRRGARAHCAKDAGTDASEEVPSAAEGDAGRDMGPDVDRDDARDRSRRPKGARALPRRPTRPAQPRTSRASHAPRAPFCLRSRRAAVLVPVPALVGHTLRRRGRNVRELGVREFAGVRGPRRTRSRHLLPQRPVRLAVPGVCGAPGIPGAPIAARPSVPPRVPVPPGVRGPPELPSLPAACVATRVVSAGVRPTPRVPPVTSPCVYFKRSAS